MISSVVRPSLRWSKRIVRWGRSNAWRSSNSAAPEGFAELDDVISQQQLEEISRSYKRTAGFDPEILNKRPSLSVR